MNGSLTLPPHSSLSLYVHLPFCTVKCGYCDFYSLAGIAPARMGATVSSIVEDGRYLLPRALASGGDIESVYIGGGTPSVLSGEHLRALTSGIGDLLRKPPQEWTVELNPETVSEERLGILAEAGVTRLSVGVQTFSRAGLSALGRAATPEKTREAVELLARRWKGRWSADLILGFQGDAPERVVQDVKRLTSLGATHVSVYALTVEEGTPLAKAVKSGAVTLPGEEEVLELLRAAERSLSESGLERYEISNYAVPGDESLHNLRYWRMDPYLGLGPGATSTLYYPTEPITGLRLEALRDLTGYLDDPRSRYVPEQLSTEELLEEVLIMGLRTREGVALKRLTSRFGIPPEAAERALGECPLLRISPEDGGRLTVHPEGWIILDRAVLEAAERLLPLLAVPY
ncbi:MAG: radical SAM family heme chaperone HemW [Spirochaetaceae bacterium]